MINCICVEHMTKSFDSFKLEDIHFSMKPS